MSAPTSAATVRARVSTGTNRIKIVERDSAYSDAELASVPVTALRGPTGLILTATEAAGGFNLIISSNKFLAQGEVTDNETEASVCWAQVALPPNYRAGKNLTVRLPCALVKSGSPTDNGSTVDLSVYLQAGGAVGSDLCATAAQTFAALDTYYNKDFTVTGAGLLPGDVLNLKITSSVVDSEAGAGTIIFTMDAVRVLGPISG